MLPRYLCDTDIVGAWYDISLVLILHKSSICVISHGFECFYFAGIFNSFNTIISHRFECFYFALNNACGNACGMAEECKKYPIHMRAQFRSVSSELKSCFRVLGFINPCLLTLVHPSSLCWTTQSP